MGFRSAQTAYYFERFGYGPEQIASEPEPDLGLVVVIPCYNEPGLMEAIRSVFDCASPLVGFEVIVVVNAPIDAPAEIHERNRRTSEEAQAWAAKHRAPSHVIDCLLPPKVAGVGLARKIGMDEALRRLDRVGRLDGVIACFDADCTCDPNYLVAVEQFFREHPQAPGSSIYFEHPLEGEEGSAVCEGGARYELHLRYYLQGLRYAGFPHAYHTIGSSMAVRANAYLQQGGMNKRKAGEDFYFLHKIIPLGGFGEVNDTRVVASPRPSDRVPFGTGKAVRSYLESGQLLSYPLEAFEDLRGFFGRVRECGAELDGSGLPATLARFLETLDFKGRLREMRKHSATPETFRKRFFRWFDGFQAMKYIHFARDTAYGAIDPAAAGAELLKRIGAPAPGASTPDLLHQYRRLQRGGVIASAQPTRS